MSNLTFGVITVSDTCSKDASKDKSGPKIVELIKETYQSNSIKTFVVQDDKIDIKSKLNSLINESINVIITTGGTGFAPRDVTPEATQEIIDRNAMGIVIAMMMKGLESTKFAALSRAVCGISKKTLIINFPGKLNAVIECFENIKTVLPHAVGLINDDIKLSQHDHENQSTSHDSNVKSKVVNVSSAYRIRTSTYPMVEVPKAIEIILDQVASTTDFEVIDIDKSLGKILAENIVSMDSLPPFRASIKDGYAIKIQDMEYKIIKDVNAGDELADAFFLNPGEAVRISTGAPVPDSADAVVQIEDTVGVNDGDDEIAIKLTIKPSVNQDIREIGSDITRNELIFKKDNIIDVGMIGVLATLGKASVKVYRNPSIGILSTGNELQDYKLPLKPYHIRDTNKITLTALLKKYNFEANDCGIVKDNADALKAAFERALSKNDVLITTGGVSMGEYDLIKNVLQVDFNAKIHFGRINMKPGKPTTFATCVYNGKYKLIFALPGNPASAAVTTYLFVIPALRKFINNKLPNLTTISVTYEGDGYKLDVRPEYVRANIFNNRATPLGNQISSRINSLVHANALLIFPGVTQEAINSQKSMFGTNSFSSENYDDNGLGGFGSSSNKHTHNQSNIFGKTISSPGIMNRGAIVKAILID